jgi:hypothetical protein
MKNVPSSGQAGTGAKMAPERLTRHHLLAVQKGVVAGPKDSGKAGGDPAPGSSTTFVDNGGPVIANAQVQLIFWGTAWAGSPTPSAASVTNGVSEILSSSYLTALRQYRNISPATLRGTTLAAGSDPPNPFQDSDVSGLINGLIQAGTIPEPDEAPGIFYCVILPPGVSSAGGAFIGEHTFFTFTEFDFPFDFDNDNAHFAWITNDGTLDSITTIFSHELVEACTDPEGSAVLGTAGTCSQTGWCEIGDVCNSTGRVNGVQVQSYWSQRGGVCIVPKFGPIATVACAIGAQADLQICGIDETDGLWHTIRKGNGLWPFGFGDVQSQTRLVGPNPGIGPTPRVACATALNGDMHVCVLDEGGGLWHTIRRADGTWPFAFGDVQAQTRKIGPNAGIGPTQYVACAVNPQGDLHLCAIDKNGGLWHTIRLADGSWPFAFGDVQAQTRKVGPNPGIGPTPRVACTVNGQGDLHVCAIDTNGGLWHTIRLANGNWPFAFGDVQAQTRKVGPNAGIGPTPRVACAVNAQGDLHVCAIDKDAGLWHTIRSVDGSWPFAFGDVQRQVRLVGPNPGIGPTPEAACSVNPQGDLHVCAIDQGHGLWHTIRRSDGTWPFAFGNVQSAVPSS